MKVGGNAAATEFFNKSPSINKDAKTKYTSRVAIAYKEKLEQRKAEDMIRYGSKTSSLDSQSPITHLGNRCQSKEDRDI